MLSLIHIYPAYMKQDVFHIVFFIVLFSIALQGTLLALSLIHI